jgi:hypothetical protein
VRRSVFRTPRDFRVNWHGEYAQLGDHVTVPSRMTLTVTGDGVPTIVAEIEIGDDKVPRLHEVRVTSPEGREVRNVDLLWIDADKLVEIAAVLCGDGRRDPSSAFEDDESDRIRRTVRRTRKRSQINADLLAQVARLYTTAESKPTQTVATTLGVADRTARLYVRRARDAGLLPEYERGGGGQ